MAVTASQEETLVEPAVHESLPTQWGAYSGIGLGVILLMTLICWNLYEVCYVKQVEFEDKQAELQRLRQTVYTAEYMNHQLKARVAHLKTDSGVEEIAREKLGLLAPGEVSFVVVPALPHAIGNEMSNVPRLPAPEIGFYQKFLHKVFIHH